MEKYLFFVFLLLVLALVLLLVKRPIFGIPSRAVRGFLVTVSVLFYVVWFAHESISLQTDGEVSLQIINKLPQTIDFYTIKANDEPNHAENFAVMHPGKVRPEHFREEFISFENFSQFWVLGYVGKENLVYFSKFQVPKKGEKQVVHVKNYTNLGLEYTKKAKELVEESRRKNGSDAVWITLSFILMFLNIALLVKKK